MASETPKLKTAVKEMVKTDLKDKWNNKVEKLEVQGDFIKLLITEDSDVSWKSYIYGVPKGVMEWAMRSSTNILATPDNLKRWKKVRSDLCKMCQVPNKPAAKCTLMHILNNCETFLEYRYLWRHNSIVTFIESRQTNIRKEVVNLDF